MRIGLFGIGGLYNFGCEAIVRGTVSIIRRVNQKAEITYYSYRSEEDNSVIRDLKINVIQVNYGLSISQRIENALLNMMNSNRRVMSPTYKDIVKSNDVIISIGGDIYTIPKYIRDTEKYQYYQSLVQFGDYVMKHDVKYIINGASIGPFGHYQKAIEYYRKHLQKADLIVCREQLSIDYLSQINITDNVCFLPDPAFYVPSSDIHSLNKNYIGLNVSPLSLNELYGEITDGSKNKLAQLIVSIAVTNATPVLLLPHVISPTSESDNDMLFMEDLMRFVPTNHRNEVKLYEGNSFINIKEGIHQCKIVISARMHCAINSILEGVPTIFLTYSSKAEGVARYIYGNDNWIVPIESIHEKLLQKTSLLLETCESVEDFLIKRVVEIRNDGVATSAVGYVRLERMLQVYE